MFVKGIFDTDHHLTPPPDFWTSRMAQKYQDGAPRVIDMPDGGQAWSFQGGAYLHAFGLENTGGVPTPRLNWKCHYRDLDPAFYEPKARIAAMDADGIDVALLFPSVAGFTARIQDDDLYRECVRVYNDAVWDWCQDADPARLLPAALIPISDVETAIAEVDRVAKMGFRHVQHPGYPGGGAWPGPGDDPFWAALQEAGLVLSLHGGGGGPPRLRGTAAPPPKAKTTTLPIEARRQGVGGRGSGAGVSQTLGQLVLSGVLERFPGLKVVLIETAAGWLPAFLEQLDAAYLQHRGMAEMKLSRLPSASARDVKISFDRESQAVKYRHLIGIDNLMFGTDYPHIGSLWPHTRLYLDMIFNGVPQHEADKVLWENGAGVYGVKSLALA